MDAQIYLEEHLLWESRGNVAGMGNSTSSKKNMVAIRKRQKHLLLKELPGSCPSSSDEKKRLLGQGLYELGDFREAANAWLIIEEKTAQDLALEELGYSYYWLALAQKKNVEDYQLEAEEKASILDLLRKACALPACPAEAFLWLDNLVRRAENDD